MNQVWLDEFGIIHIEVVGSQTQASVRAMGEETAVFVADLRRDGRPVYVLDNLKAMGETDPAARHEVARQARLLQFDRAAMVGDGSAIMRHGTNLMLRAIGRSNVRYFSSMDAAKIWFGLK